MVRRTMAIKLSQLFISFSIIVQATVAQHCHRILFQRNRSTEIFEWDHLLNVVYVTTTMETEFPVYIAERGGVTFSYDRQRQNFIFAKEKTGEILLRLNKTNTINIFTYSNKTRNRTVQLSYQCTEATECPGKINVQFRQQGNRGSRDYRFSTETGVFINHRRVYKEENGKYILFYNRTGYWNIASIPILKTQYTVKSQAFRLEFITEQQWLNRTGHPTEATLKCVRNQKDKCECLNYGRCIENQNGHCWCVCRYGFTGQNCGIKITKKCPKIRARGFRTISYGLGAIGTEPCDNGYKTMIMSCQINEQEQPVWVKGDCGNSTGGNQNDSGRVILQSMAKRIHSLEMKKKFAEEKNVDLSTDDVDTETETNDHKYGKRISFGWIPRGFTTNYYR